MDAAIFERAVHGFGRRISAVPADGWSGPTPCDEWDVRALANHVTGELLWVPPLLAGQTIAEVGDRFDGDVLGDDPAATYAEAARAALEAAARPGAREAIAHLSFGDFPGSEYLDQVGTDVVIHTWDLSRATGQPEELDDDLVGAVWDYLSPVIEGWRSGGAFGPAVAVGADASAQDRMLAMTGRAAARR